jgi:glucose/arabinose dehydrogenase
MTLESPAGIRENELQLSRAVAAAWQPLMASSVDLTRKTVEAEINSFSTFGILGVSVASVLISPQSPTIQIGESLQLTATVRDEAGNLLPDRPITWASSDGDIVGVDQTGLVTGLVTGQAIVTGTSEGQEGRSLIMVAGGQPADPTLELVATGLSSPVFATAPPGDTERLFVVERGGLVRIIRGDILLTTPFLDVGSIILSGRERGLLSMVFHPDYSQNGEFFVNYTDLNGDTRVVRYRVSADPNIADPGSAELIISIEQPFANHNGGQLAFGPDGMLYIGMGDGGSGGDPEGHGQDLGTQLGSILRIDVDGGAPYAVPADNPYVGNAAARDEIWANGLRNPWRFSFDRELGDLYIADVGQNAWEEVDVQPAMSAGGENYGWNVMEGAHCFDGGGCDQTGLVLPVVEYSHADGCSVTGGYVYRGSRLPQLVGHYLYSDFCSGWVRSFRFEDGQAVEERDWSSELVPGNSISSFGEDALGELYIMTLGGNLYRIVPAQP